MSGRKLNSLEQKLHQAGLSASDKTLSQKEVDALAPDAAPRTGAINFLLSAGLFKVLTDNKGRISFRAVIKKELDAKKDMSGEESMVLSHIQAAGNEGIWTKHIKAKTELHQTVIDRCLKSLVQKQLVKAVKSVKHPTRKIYMLFHLDPSVEITGGPWYTDNELDTEFIKLLSRACLQFIKDRSFPKQKRNAEGEAIASTQQQLYSISAAPAYPTAQHVQMFLTKGKITETQLSVEHVEMLINLLVLDGEVERVPAFGAALWESSLANDDDYSDDDKRHGKKRKHGSDDRTPKSKKRRRHSDDESDSSDGKSKRSKSRKSKHKKRRGDDERSEHDSETEPDKRRSTSRQKSRSRASSSSDSSGSESDSSDSDHGRSKKSRSRSRSKSKSRRSSQSRKRSSSPMAGGSNLQDFAEGAYSSAAHVYRAIRSDHAASASFMGWSSQVPCGRCPVFDFCKEGGPVNPSDCVYYGEWLEKGVVTIE